MIINGNQVALPGNLDSEYKIDTITIVNENAYKKQFDTDFVFITCEINLKRKDKVQPDNVNHPLHYTTGKYEIIDVIEDWGFDKDFLLANVIKYIARSPHKNKELEDLKKARWYLDRKISKLENK